MNKRRLDTPARLRLAIVSLSTVVALSAAACAPAQTPSPTVTPPPATATMEASLSPTLVESGQAGVAASPVSQASPASTSTATPAPVPAEAVPLPTETAPAPTEVPAPASPTAMPAASATPTAPPAPTVAPVQSTASVALSRHVGPELASGELSGLVPSADGDGLVPASAGEGTASVTSAPQTSAIAFDNLILSWAAAVPDDASLRALVRVGAGGEWSDWYTMGRWENGAGSSERGQSDAWGRVDVDTLQLTRPAETWQYRIDISGGGQEELPVLRSVTVALKDTTRPPQGPPVALAADWARELALPSESQAIQDPAVAWQICSPTSLTMILRAWGLETTVPTVYAGVRDATNGIYGNWPLNTAYAAQQGFDAYVARFYSLDQVRNEIAAGRPVIVSIRYSAGELPGAPLNSTSGHIVVVRGFTADGKVIVNDPAAPNRDLVRRVLNAADLERVWLRSGGIAYVVAPR